MTRPLFVVTEVAPYRDGPAGVHGVLPQAAEALRELGSMAGLSPVLTSDVGGIDPAELAAGGVLALFTIGETPWSPAQRAAVAEGVRAGRLGILGVHSATDACRDWDDYGSLLGARFDGHPWTAEFTVEVTGPAHPATGHLASSFTWHDEVYLFAGMRPDATVLLRVAEGCLDMTVPGARLPEIGMPLCWCHTEGVGRVFYTSLGHFPGAWETPSYLRHVAGGLGWVLETAA
ncbi:MAG: ThuA domain-containing protein [Acidobacteriota bacterium]|nr:ThuA domain-containing protein [Acidobacteriota bacterium]